MSSFRFLQGGRAERKIARHAPFSIGDHSQGPVRDAQGSPARRLARAEGQVPGVVYRRAQQPLAISLDPGRCAPRSRASTASTPPHARDRGRHRRRHTPGAAQGSPDRPGRGPEAPARRLSRGPPRREDPGGTAGGAGPAAPIGVLEGGILQQIAVSRRWRCPPDIPLRIEVDVCTSRISQSIHVAELKMPEGAELKYQTNSTIAGLGAGEGRGGGPGRGGGRGAAAAAPRQLLRVPVEGERTAGAKEAAAPGRKGRQGGKWSHEIARARPARPVRSSASAHPELRYARNRQQPGLSGGRCARGPDYEWGRKFEGELGQGSMKASGGEAGARQGPVLFAALHEPRSGDRGGPGSTVFQAGAVSGSWWCTLRATSSLGRIQLKQGGVRRAQRLFGFDRGCDGLEGIWAAEAGHRPAASRVGCRRLRPWSDFSKAEEEAVAVGGGAVGARSEGRHLRGNSAEGDDAAQPLGEILMDLAWDRSTAPCFRGNPAAVTWRGNEMPKSKPEHRTEHPQPIRSKPRPWRQARPWPARRPDRASWLREYETIYLPAVRHHRRSRRQAG